ncbi:AmmeMemoRadiSam system protein B [Methylomonas sp. AM2-LC]|uniref:AmmeMemoRadiSam system protein B n=1 Tax=Methylomonas sp. AM2-LC TaxID=3153301 RepID=UPI003263DDCE
MNRKPAVAGIFYPAEPLLLKKTIDDYLAGATKHGKAPKAMIVPHAGYIYSGSIAASAYARLIPAGNSISRVVLIGPSHRVAFPGLAISNTSAYSTPLGEVILDTSAIATLDRLPFVNYIEQAHLLEHSLEVHIPFLQSVLPNFSLIPIVTGDASIDQVCEVLELLWGGDETLLVISSDLSHYHDYATAQQIDQTTSRLIEDCQYEILTSENACGQLPISGLLKLLAKKSLAIETIDLRNSGDTAGDKQRVVGYGAFVVN